MPKVNETLITKLDSNFIDNGKFVAISAMFTKNSLKEMGYSDAFGNVKTKITDDNLDQAISDYLALNKKHLTNMLAKSSELKELKLEDVDQEWLDYCLFTEGVGATFKKLKSKEHLLEQAKKEFVQSGLGNFKQENLSSGIENQPQIKTGGNQPLQTDIVANAGSNIVLSGDGNIVLASGGITSNANPTESATKPVNDVVIINQPTTNPEADVSLSEDIAKELEEKRKYREAKKQSAIISAVDNNSGFKIAGMVAPLGFATINDAHPYFGAQYSSSYTLNFTNKEKLLADDKLDPALNQTTLSFVLNASNRPVPTARFSNAEVQGKNSGIGNLAVSTSYLGLLDAGVRFKTPIADNAQLSVNVGPFLSNFPANFDVKDLFATNSVACNCTGVGNIFPAHFSPKHALFSEERQNFQVGIKTKDLSVTFGMKPWGANSKSDFLSKDFHIWDHVLNIPQNSRLRSDNYTLEATYKIDHGNALYGGVYYEPTASSNLTLGAAGVFNNKKNSYEAQVQAISMPAEAKNIGMVLATAATTFTGFTNDKGAVSVNTTIGHNFTNNKPMFEVGAFTEFKLGNKDMYEFHTAKPKFILGVSLGNFLSGQSNLDWNGGGYHFTPSILGGFKIDLSKKKTSCPVQ
jgi:hypothetical protein